jgi:predicted nucleic acid-binding protein
VSRPVFLDTSGWLAVLSGREAHHVEASDVYRAVLAAGGGFLTTNLVVAEMHVLLVRHRGSEAGIRLLDALKQDPTHEIRYVTPELERQAIDRWLRSYSDHRFSLTDVVSFEVMRAERIGEALALDSHFRIAGFETLPHFS